MNQNLYHSVIRSKIVIDIWLKFNLKEFSWFHENYYRLNGQCKSISFESRINEREFFVLIKFQFKHLTTFIKSKFDTQIKQMGKERILFLKSKLSPNKTNLVQLNISHSLSLSLYCESYWSIFGWFVPKKTILFNRELIWIYFNLKKSKNLNDLIVLKYYLI